MLLDFLLPSPCVVCGRLPKPLCSECLPQPGFQLDRGAFLNLYYSNELTGDFELIMKSYKDKSRMALESVLATLLHSLIMEVARYESFDCYALPPRNQGNYQRRGFVPIERLVRKTALSKFRRILVDDVATTGATLLEMRRALEAAGYQVVASCVLARRFGFRFDS